MKLYIETMKSNVSPPWYSLFHTQLDIGYIEKRIPYNGLTIASSHTNLLQCLEHLFIFASDNGILPTIEISSKELDRFDIRNLK